MERETGSIKSRALIHRRAMELGAWVTDQTGVTSPVCVTMCFMVEASQLAVPQAALLDVVVVKSHIFR